MAKKNATKLRNPFVYQGYASPDYFCDRIVETEELISNLQNGRNTVLISQRRIGKTGLIKNVFHHLSHTEKDAVCIYVDIMATKNQHDFVQLLGTAIAQDVMSREQMPGSYYLKPWANSEEGLNFTIGKDGYIRFNQFTGDTYPNYGDIYFMDLEAYNPAYTQYLGKYDSETKTYTFAGSYFIPAAGAGFGLVSETFVLGATAPAEAQSIPAKELGMKMDRSMKAASRFIPTKVEKSPRMTNHAANLPKPVLF